MRNLLAPALVLLLLPVSSAAGLNEWTYVGAFRWRVFDNELHLEWDLERVSAGATTTTVHGRSRGLQGSSISVSFAEGQGRAIPLSIPDPGISRVVFRGTEEAKEPWVNAISRSAVGTPSNPKPPSTTTTTTRTTSSPSPPASTDRTPRGVEGELISLAV